MIQVNIAEAKTNLSKLLARLRKEQVIVICRRNEPIAELRLVEKKKRKKRRLGTLKGLINIGPDFWAPMSEEELADWYEIRPSDPLYAMLKPDDAKKTGPTGS